MNSAQRIAVIDLGSNTARLVVYRATPGHCFRVEDEIREVVRLRQGMTESGLSTDAVERAFHTLRLFNSFCRALNVDVVIPTATSAVRDAANGLLFVDRVARELGLTLQILDGEREAYYGAIGALNDVDLRDGFVLDVGGGSAQISRVENRCFVRGQSAPIGALALTEGYIKSDPPHQRELAAVQIEIDRRLDALFWHRDEEGPLTGLGGAIRNLAAIDAAAGHYPLETLHGYVLSAANLDAIVEQLASTSLEGRRKIAGLNPDRADIILPGAMVAQSVMCRLGVDRLTISTNGLREGLLFEHFWRHLAEPVAPDVRSFGTLNLARIYEYNKSHATHVRFLARRLFDQLGPLHGYGPAERDLLDAASTLHDIGTVVAYDKHDRHGFTLISNNGLPGYTPREIGLIALLTRYHRKGTPKIDPFRTILREDDTKRLNTLSALLRLAEYFERGRNGAVDDVVVNWDDAKLRLTLIAELYPAVEIWQAQRNALELVEATFARTVHIESTAAPNAFASNRAPAATRGQ